MLPTDGQIVSDYSSKQDRVTTPETGPAIGLNKKISRRQNSLMEAGKILMSQESLPEDSARKLTKDAPVGVPKALPRTTTQPVGMSKNQV